MEPIRETNKTNPIQTPEGSMPEGPIKSLPPELVRVIFSQMESLDPTQLLNVSKLLKTEVINTVKEEEFLTAKSFIASLIENLKFISTELQVDDMELEPDERSQLEVEIKVIDEVIKKLASITVGDKNVEEINIPFNLVTIKTSLVTIKTSLVNVEEKIIDILKDLDRETLFTLAEMCEDNKTPVTWNLEVYPKLVQETNDKTANLFLLASASKIIESMKVTDDDSIMQLCAQLKSRGLVDRAVKLSDTISDPVQKMEMIKWLSMEVCEAGYFDKGMKIADEHKIKDDVLKELKSKKIHDLSNKATAFLLHGQFDEAIEIVSSIENETLRNETFQFLATQLLTRNNFEDAIKVCDLITDDSLKDPLKNVIRYYLESKKNDADPETIKKMTDLQNRL